MNPYGLGVDIVEIGRIRAAYSKTPRILARLFTENELTDFKERGSRAETLAGKFAAKEAVVKAMGTGVRGFAWTDLEILSDELGKPSCFFYGNAAEKIKELRISQVLISIAHNRTIAIANAMAVIQEDSDEIGNQ